jgi:hypothetical protein
MAKHRSALIGSLCLALLCPDGTALRAQGTPREAAESIFAALGRRDWPSAVARLDSQTLAEFQTNGVAVLAAQAYAERTRGSGGAEVAGAPTTRRELGRAGRTPVRAFRSARDLAGAAALSPQAFFADYLQTLDQIFAEVSAPRTIVGVLLEGDSLAHVLYRADYAARRGQGRILDGDAARPPWSVVVLTLRQRNGRWLAMPNSEIASHSVFFVNEFAAPASRQ